MAYYKDIREFMKLLEDRGALYRYRDPINKETELIPFHRVQMRGLPDEERKAILFEKPVGADGQTYGDMSVLVGVYASSEKLFGWAMGCETYQEAIERFCHGLDNPIQPVMVENAPVHEEVHTGDELKELGLDEIPVPVEEVGLSGIVRFGLPMLTKDPETGTINLGTYNGFFRDRDRIAAGIGPIRATMIEHWRKHREHGDKGVPVAIIVGPTPALMAVSSAEIPYGKPGVDEFSVTGGIGGEPLELVRAKTVPLDVPARAEMVIEGYLSTEVLEPRTPFGEYPGYLSAEMNMIPVINVTAITHRKGAMFTDIIVGLWPSDCNVVWAFAHNALMYHYLKYQHNLPVEEVYFPQEAGAALICIIRVSDGVTPEKVWEILRTAANHPRLRPKYYMAVDYDIDVRDNENILWSLSTRTQPNTDTELIPGGAGGGLDPSAAPTGSGRGLMSSTAVREGNGFVPREYARMLINATRNWPYPPVALPLKQYMERAVELWNARGDLPKPKLKNPWYGYTLGYWPEDLEEYAELIAKGQYRKVGEMMKAQQRPATDDLMIRHTGTTRLLE